MDWTCADRWSSWAQQGDWRGHRTAAVGAAAAVAAAASRMARCTCVRTHAAATPTTTACKPRAPTLSHKPTWGCVPRTRTPRFILCACHAWWLPSRSCADRTKPRAIPCATLAAAAVPTAYAQPPPTASTTTTGTTGHGAPTPTSIQPGICAWGSDASSWGRERVVWAAEDASCATAAAAAATGGAPAAADAQLRCFRRRARCVFVLTSVWS